MNTLLQFSSLLQCWLIPFSLTPLQPPTYIQYCAMPVIQYPQLENELFCNIFYLRHLCDTQKFPDWPIKEPVGHMTTYCMYVLGVFYYVRWNFAVYRFSLLHCVALGQAAKECSGSLEERGGEKTTRDVCGPSIWCTGPWDWSGRVS